MRFPFSDSGPSAPSPRVMLAGVCASWTALVVYLLLWSPNFTDPVPGGDYVQFYMAARIYRHGSADRLYDLAYQLEFQNDEAAMHLSLGQPLSGFYLYPPQFVWFCLLFSYLPFKVGAFAWALFMAGCLFAAQWLAAWIVTANRAAVGYALFAGLLFTPALIAVTSCQSAPLALLITSGAYTLLRSQKPLAAGAVFGLLAFKPQLGLIIGVGLLWKRQWRFVLGGLVTALLSVGAALAVSPTASVDYVRLGPTLARWIDLPNFPLAEMSNWRGFWRLLLTGTHSGLAEAVSTLSSLVTLALMLLGLRAPLDPSSERFPRQFAVLVLATVLVSPHLLAYDLTLLLLPMALVLGAYPPLLKSRARDRVWLGTGIIYLTACVSRWVAAAVGVQLIVPVIFVYLVMLVVASRNASAPPSSSPYPSGL